MFFQCYYCFSIIQSHVSVRGHSESMFAQDSQLLTPTPSLFGLVCFQATPHPHSSTQGTFVLARTHPLPLQFLYL